MDKNNGSNSNSGTPNRFAGDLESIMREKIGPVPPDRAGRNIQIVEMNKLLSSLAAAYPWFGDAIVALNEDWGWISTRSYDDSGC